MGYQNVLDYAVKTATDTATQKERTRAEKEKATAIQLERTRAEKEKSELLIRAEKEKRTTALTLKKNNVSAQLIADATGLSIEEIEVL